MKFGISLTSPLAAPMLDGLRTPDPVTLSEAQGSWGHGPVHEYGSLRSARYACARYARHPWRGATVPTRATRFVLLPPPGIGASDYSLDKPPHVDFRLLDGRGERVIIHPKGVASDRQRNGRV